MICDLECVILVFRQIRKEYYEDYISAGPQSRILEGISWDEAQRIKVRSKVTAYPRPLVYCWVTGSACGCNSGYKMHFIQK